MSQETIFFVVAIVLAVGLLGIVMIEASYTPHRAAGKGCPTGNVNGVIDAPGAIHSGGKCIH